uniref:Formin like 1 n=1 Tax=Pseudonaja textilis TaxID=8673 RepID=A0A670YX14_PSETE
MASSIQKRKIPILTTFRSTKKILRGNNHKRGIPSIPPPSIRYKMRLLGQYDNEKKWELICDQERFQVKNPPSAYIQKLKSYLDTGGFSGKFKRRVQESTQVLRELEISLRTNHIGSPFSFYFIAKASINPTRPPVDAHLCLCGSRFDMDSTDNGSPGSDKGKALDRSVEDLSRSNCSPTQGSIKTRHLTALRNSRIVSQKDDVHVCIMCLRAIMNYQSGFSLVMNHPACVNEITLSLNNKNPRTKALVLELLAAVCLVRGGHDIILAAFDNFKEVCGEKNHFEKLMDYFRNEDSNIDFMVACMQFINIVVHSVENMNFRAFLQYQFTQLGLDEYLQKLRCTESDKLQVQIQAYLDNIFDVGALLEETETKNAILEHIEDLQEEVGQVGRGLTEQILWTMHILRWSRSSNSGGKKYFNTVVSYIFSFPTDLGRIIFQWTGRHFSHLFCFLSDYPSLSTSPVPTLAPEIPPPPPLPSMKGSDSVAFHSSQEEELSPIPTPLLPPPPPPLPGIIEPPPAPSLPGVVTTPQALSTPPPPPPPLPSLLTFGGPVGAPPPPPPPLSPMIDGATLPASTITTAVKIKKPIQTKFRMPVFNWVALKPNQINGTIFNELNDEKVLQELDMSDFEEQFKTKAQGPNKEFSSTKAKTLQKAPAKVSLIECNRAKNLAITLRKGGLDVDSICKAIQTYDLQTLNLDFLELLMRFIPTEYEMTLIRKYEKEQRPLDELSDEDQFMIKLSKIPRLAERMNIMTFLGSFADTVQLLLPQLNFVIVASMSVKSSTKLRQILEIVLAFGNYLNSSKRGAAYGFRLQSLDALLDMKSTDRKQTLLHYIVRVIQEKYPEFLNFSNELHFLDKAGAVSLDSVLQDVRSLQRGMELARKEFMRQDDNVILKDFLKTNTEMMEKLQTDSKTAQEAYESTVEYFGENPKTTPPTMFFPIFVRFVKAYQVKKKNLFTFPLLKFCKAWSEDGYKEPYWNILNQFFFNLKPHLSPGLGVMKCTIPLYLEGITLERAALNQGKPETIIVV